MILRGGCLVSVPSIITFMLIMFIVHHFSYFYCFSFRCCDYNLLGSIQVRQVKKKPLQMLAVVRFNNTFFFWRFITSRWFLSCLPCCCPRHSVGSRTWTHNDIARTTLLSAEQTRKRHVSKKPCITH